MEKNETESEEQLGKWLLSSRQVIVFVTLDDVGVYADEERPPIAVDQVQVVQTFRLLVD